MKLISMTDFVIQQRSELMFKELGKACCKYADFLKQPLKLEMFVACDEMMEVMNYEEIKQSVIEGTDSWDAYEKAKEKVLFEGFEVIKDTRTTITVFNSKTKQEIGFAKGVGSGETIESLILFTDFTGNLTPSAIKQIQP